MSAAGAGAAAPSGTGTGEQLPEGAPPPPPPPGAPPLPPRAAAPPPPVAPPRPPKGNGGTPKGGQPLDADPRFLKRVRQEASRQLRRELGDDVSLEDVKRLLAEKKAKDAAAAGGAPGTPAAGKSQREIELEAQVAERDARIKKQNRKLVKTKKRQERDAVRVEMRMEARSAGIQERYVNFALTEYGGLFASFSANPDSVPPEIKAAFSKEPDVDGRAVFAYIKAQAPMIGETAPIVVPLDPSTAPPASRAPGETTPKPKPPGTKGQPFDASKLSPEEWDTYKRKNGLNFG